MKGVNPMVFRKLAQQKRDMPLDKAILSSSSPFTTDEAVWLALAVAGEFTFMI